MMAAEQWYEYQDSYKKYGIDMKPRETKAPKQKKKSHMSSKDRARLLVLTIFAGVLGIAVVIASAYAASIQYEINSVIKENNAISGEIEVLQVKLMTATNIGTIEQRAMAELGMVAPSPEQMVFLADKEKPSGDFAIMLKEQAYN